MTGYAIKPALIGYQPEHALKITMPGVFLISYQAATPGNRRKHGHPRNIPLTDVSVSVALFFVELTEFFGE
jgi:hypothetical protein